MSINAKQLRELIIRPTLHDMAMWSESAENMVIGTAAQESHLGEHIKQIGGGPALGLYQCEPATHADVYSYLRNNEFRLFGKTLPNDLRPVGPVNHERLIYDLRYATMICRLHYYRHKMPLPPADDVEQLAVMWKTVYNTRLGKGRPEEFVRNYERYVING
jgi:hypothetical protein